MTLPKELIGMIFIHSLCFLTNPHTWDNMRRNIRLLSHNNQAIIESLPEAWSAIYVSFYTTRSYTDFQFKHAGTRALTVFIHFVDVERVIHKAWSRRDVRGLVEYTFARLTTSARKCTQLAVNAYTSNATSSILGWIARLRANSITVLTVNIAPSSPDLLAFEHGTMPDSEPSTTYTALKDLSIQGILPMWKHGQPYAHLQSLTLHKLRGRASLTWNHACLMLDVMKNLKALRLDDIECRGIPMTSESLPESSQLTELTVTLTHETCARLVSKIDAPALEKFRIASTSDLNLYYAVVIGIYQSQREMQAHQHNTLAFGAGQSSGDTRSAIHAS